MYLLKASNAALGATGILHLVALCVGQKPVVSTRTFKSTLCKFTFNEIKKW